MKIANTPFYNFMNSEALVVDAYMLDDICGHYKGDDIFRFGDIEFTCLDEDFARCLVYQKRDNQLSYTELNTEMTSTRHAFTDLSYRGRILVLDLGNYQKNQEKHS